MNGEMSFGNRAGKMKAILRAAGIAALAAFFCVGCGDNSTGGGGGKEEPASTYTITFDPNGGMVTPNSGKTNTDGTLASLPTPTRNGHTFSGWFTAKTDGEAVTESTVFGNDATIYAQWTLNVYKITFDANGGIVTPDSGMTGDGWKLASLPTPTRDGYTFSGWFTAATGGTALTKDTAFSKTATIYARWTLNTYKINFDANGGTVTPDTGTTGDGWKLASLSTPTRNGYNFSGWFTAKTDGTAVTKDTAFSKDTTIYAQWTFIPYKITFNANGGTVTPDIGTTGDGWKLASLPTPTRDGYIFSGWFTVATGGTAVTEDSTFSKATTIYAQWTLKTYTITLDANGGSLNGARESYTTGAGWTLTPNGYITLPFEDPYRTGYTFAGWYTAATDGKRVTGITVFSNDTTIYALWTLRTYWVAFDSQNGSGMGSQDKEYGDKVTKPANPTRTGYTFGGWYTEDTYTTLWNFDTDTVTSYMTLYAKWNIIQYTITFDANGGEVISESGTTGEGWKLASLPTPTRSGYFFNGWFTAASGGETVTTDKIYSADAAIYAQWTPIYTITFNATGGTVTPESGTTDESLKLTSLPTPTKDGYGFNGWYTEETGGTMVTTSTAFNADAAIYAQWFISYTITFNATDGEVTLETGMTNIDKRLVLLPTPTKSGYLFTGWYTEETGGTKVTTSTVFSADAIIYAQWFRTTFTDSRDGQTYRRVVIGNQVWMAQNLNYDVPDVTTDVCYDNIASNCAQYGRLYDWSTAMGIDASYNVNVWSGGDVNRQGACPVGWHLPSRAEWRVLTDYVGTSAPQNIKSTTGWYDSGFGSGNSTDEYGFSALPGGSGNGSGKFENAGYYGYWWNASSEGNSGNARSQYLTFNGGMLNVFNNKYLLYSVRCVQD